MTRRRKPSPRKRQRRAARNKARKEARRTRPEPPPMPDDHTEPFASSAWRQTAPTQAQPARDPRHLIDQPPESVNWREEKAVTITAIVITAFWLALAAGAIIALWP